MIRLYVLETLKHELFIVRRDGHLDLVTPKPQAFLANAARTQNLKGHVAVIANDAERMGHPSASLCASQIAPVSMHSSVDALITSGATLVNIRPPVV